MSQVIELNSQDFEEKVINNSGVVLVDFYAQWCMPCKILAPEMEKLAAEYDQDFQITIAKVNTETSPDLAIRLGVRGIPNVIIFKQGKVVKQIVGLRKSEDYKAILESI